MESISQLIARLRRSTRNADILRLCDEHEALLRQSGAPMKKGFDRKTYMRSYMRDRRAKERGEPC